MNAILFNKLYCQPWNISRDFFIGLNPGNFAIEDFFTPRSAMEIDANGVAHIAITGVLGDLMPIDEKLGMGSSYDSIATEIEGAAQQARAIMLHVDSPGGQAAGNAELAAMFSETRLPKAAHVSGTGASAAYCIAAGADRITADPSAIVGSIGTIIARLDVSGLWESKGVKPDYIKSGELKAAWMPPSLTPEERAHLQQIVDDTFSLFRGHVLKHRRIDESNMQGQVFVGSRARAANIIDAVSSKAEAYQSLVKRIKK